MKIPKTISTKTKTSTAKLVSALAPAGMKGVPPKPATPPKKRYV